ncbi:MAG: nucleotidyl transferase AbiEii/AbiGii toxin family protein [Candidatus Acidiferrales bacterium]
MIRQRNISRLANRLASDGSRRIPEAVLERDYCLAWFLVGLSGSLLKPVIGFKGGTALKRCYFDDYRFSEDLDFTLLRATPLEEILQHLEALFIEVQQASGIQFRFERMDRHGHVNSDTFYLGYSGPLPAPNSVKVDITVREIVIYPPVERPVLRSYPEFEDIPEGREITVYSLDEIAIEKTVALADAARTEPRDLYDLWYLTTEGGVELGNLHEGTRQKLAFREKPFAGIQAAVATKQNRLRSLWETRLAEQMARLPEFDEVFRFIRRTLRQAGLP